MNLQKNHYGGIVAAPVFREIVHEAFNYMNIPRIFNTPPARDVAETGA
ncbi:MAG: hypothetical protein R2860_06975 [Desulfobacterales bacterium]